MNRPVVPEPQPHALAAVLAELPPEWNDADLFSTIQTRVRDSQRLVAVLDDDPTGTQTVHDVPVLTRWHEPLLTQELARAGTVIYLLTNSRSLSPTAADILNRDLGDRLVRAARTIGRELHIISRSDSTLRGHYPLEINALQSALSEHGQTIDGHLIVPCFVEGGRMTINGVHWLCEGDTLVPSAQTEFARDRDFGYLHSDLRAWVAEKSRGAWHAEDVVSLRLAEIRRGPAALLPRVLALHGAAVTDAVTYSDLEVLVYALLDAEQSGRHFLYRTAASFVRVYGGIAQKPLLTRSEVVHRGGATGGLIVAGSYTDKTTRQLDDLQQHTQIQAIPLSVERVLNPDLCQREIAIVRERADDALARGQDTLIYSTRTVVSAASHLEIGKQVSAALTQTVGALVTRPRYIVAKGGITSSDVATEGLNVERAWVLGQIAPGVPVWRLGPESRFPDIPYIVFPGNVGDDATLTTIVNQLQATPC